MKKKLTIVAFSICLVVVAGLIATIIVLASGTQGVGTSVSVLYVATDIEGTVSAKYSKVNKNTSAVISTTDMVTSSGSKTVSFLSTAPTTTSLLNPTESNIALTAEQDLIITYTFTAVETYYATLEYKDNSTSASNIEFSYALNDGAYSDEMSMPIEVTPDHSTTYSIKLHIANTALNAKLSGSLNWALTKDGGKTPSGGDDRITITYANNEDTAINDSNVSIVYNSDKTKFKIVGPTPKHAEEKDVTEEIALGSVLNSDDFINSSSAEFYYFATNSAVVGTTSYVDPGEKYFTSTADSELENWYDAPASEIQLYACFIKPYFKTASRATTHSDVYNMTFSNNIYSHTKATLFMIGRSGITEIPFIIPQSMIDMACSFKGRAFENMYIGRLFIPNSLAKGTSKVPFSSFQINNLVVDKAVNNAVFEQCTISNMLFKNGGATIENAYLSCIFDGKVTFQNVESLLEGNFAQCNFSSSDIVFSDNITTLKMSFSSCKFGGKTFTIPKNVTKIYGGMFSGGAAPTFAFEDSGKTWTLTNVNDASESPLVLTEDQLSTYLCDNANYYLLTKNA